MPAGKKNAAPGTNVSEQLQSGSSPDRASPAPAAAAPAAAAAPSTATAAATESPRGSAAARVGSFAAAVRSGAADPSADGAQASAPAASSADLSAILAAVQQLGARLDGLEARQLERPSSVSSRSSAGGDSADDWSSGYSSDRSERSLAAREPAAPLYTEFRSKDNPHFLARQLRGQSHERYGRPARQLAVHGPWPGTFSIRHILIHTVII